MRDLIQLDLSEASELIQKRTVSPVELTQACLAQIERLNPQLNAFITVTADSAMDAARKAEAEIAHGAWKGPLHGSGLWASQRSPYRSMLCRGTTASVG